MKTTKSKDGTILAYDVYGNGPALIYITGASCHRSFKPIVQDAKIFATEFTVYNYDRRGRGDSGDTLPYTIEREIEDIEAIVDAAGGTAHLYGHSSGAVIALEAALRLGNKVQKVVMYDAPYVRDEKEKAEYKQLSHKIHKLLDNGRNAEAMTTFLKGIGMPKVFVLLLPLFPGWRTMKALAPTLSYDITLTQDMPPVERVTRNSIPTQIIVGEKSPASIHDVGRQLTKAIPNAKFVQLAAQDHMVNAKKLLPLLSGFLK
ncbi:alpha/beta fold hydrolase [Guptibacillus hwajinpoensis]|uniref:Pimeloyl-ACP methyl ester carboxylesterase n=1 Tax=Guptibacillus hwajinpoensis TaxID=208199 RepID=A0ABU0JXH8_9BACL|nr:alpha/beta hydrolase [Alkalihalobacillus hemicentroti]MDQ0481784.1 pimeloyl-ACP methyl ester carboxylesterase [Alkalihalobacillus hemicentroti]